MKQVKTPPRGMREFSANQVELRNYIQQTILKTYAQFGFRQIETPCVETLSLLSSGQGGDNEKLLFKILKRGEKLANSDRDNLADLGLRFDLTVPLSRYYANNIGQLPKVNKFIQIGNVWRAERPQNGRYRQFTQCDIDIVGEGSVLAELELIAATTTTLKQFGLSNFNLKINDRRLLTAIVDYCGFKKGSAGQVLITLDKLDKIGVSGIQQELLDSEFKSEAIDKLLALVKKFEGASFQDFIAYNEQVQFVDAQVLADLKFTVDTAKAQSNGDLNISFDLSLVRGMGYYTGQIFEIQVPEYPWSIAGGGRYDEMIGKLTGGKQEIPACGFSIGFERLVLILEDRKFNVPSNQERIVLLGDNNPVGITALLNEAKTLRDAGNHVLVDYRAKKMGKQLDDYKAQGFTQFAVVRENEALHLKSL